MFIKEGNIASICIATFVKRSSVLFLMKHSFYKWVGGVQGWRTSLQIRERAFDSDPTHQQRLRARHLHLSELASW